MQVPVLHHEGMRKGVGERFHEHEKTSSVLPAVAVKSSFAVYESSQTNALSARCRPWGKTCLLGSAVERVPLSELQLQTLFRADSTNGNPYFIVRIRSCAFLSAYH